MPQQSYIKIKFNSESQFLFEYGIIKTANGTYEGHCCQAFKYSGKWIITISDQNQLWNKEITWIKSLSRSDASWITGKYKLSDGFFLQDSISILSYVEKGLEQKLAAIGIYTINDIKIQSDKAIRTLGATIASVSIKAMFRLHNIAIEAFVGKYIDQTIDHKKASNPYLSLYGDKWEDQIDKSLMLRDSICVTVLIKHIVKEIKAFLQGTQFKNTPYFYHNALS